MKPKNIPSPISVNAVGKPIMITTTISVSIRSPSAGSLIGAPPGSPGRRATGSNSRTGAAYRSLLFPRRVTSRFFLGTVAQPTLACHFVDRMDVVEGLLPRLRVHQRALAKLLLDHVDFLRVLEARRPLAGLEADHA